MESEKLKFRACITKNDEFSYENGEKTSKESGYNIVHFKQKYSTGYLDEDGSINNLSLEELKSIRDVINQVILEQEDFE